MKRKGQIRRRRPPHGRLYRWYGTCYESSRPDACQYASEFELGLQVRMAERMRIARDLHDTLLQTFSALLLRFQTVRDLLPTRPEEAKQILTKAIDQAADALTEGRERVQNLRTSPDDSTTSRSPSKSFVRKSPRNQRHSAGYLSRLCGGDCTAPGADGLG